MFTRTKAVDFALEGGLKGANFVSRGGGKLVFYYWEGSDTCLKHGGAADEPLEDRLAEVLAGRGDGWFVSAKTDGEWFWYFDDSGVAVPHKGTG